MTPLGERIQKVFGVLSRATGIARRMAALTQTDLRTPTDQRSEFTDSAENKIHKAVAHIVCATSWRK
jgi:hypothetical protein